MCEPIVFLHIHQHFVVLEFLSVKNSVDNYVFSKLSVSQSQTVIFMRVIACYEFFQLIFVNNRIFYLNIIQSGLFLHYSDNLMVSCVLFNKHVYVKAALIL